MSSSKASKPRTTRTSSCNCGQVKLSVTGVDKSTVLCHCSNCQRQAGSAFMYNHRFLNAELQLDRGKDLVKAYADKNTISGNTLTRHFCSNCGCPLYFKNSAFESLVVLHCASMEGSNPPPQGELFKENKYDWLGDVGAKL